MISVESAMVQSDACATELQHTTNTVEKNNKKNMKKPMLPAIDLFPSVFHFNHANQHNMSSLLESMRCIKSNISSNINDCYEKPMKAALLKESIHQALSWILMSYRNLPKDENSSAYLESMSDLLAMYIDMELRASKRGQEQFSAISTRLICCLYTYLDNSTDYMVDTLIKIRHMSHLFHIILDPIMAKILKNIPPLPKSEIVYVRYLLGFRLWKMINSDLVGKKQIRQTAVTLLGTAPTNLPDFLINYYGSGSQTKSTLFLMKHKFDVKACCADFINFCKREAENCSQPDDKMNCHERVQDPEQQVPNDVIAKESSSIKNVCSLTEKIVNDPKNCVLLDTSNNKSNLSNDLSRISINDSTPILNNKSINKSIRPLAKRKTKKSTDIIIIDITNEYSAPKITRKKNRILIPWLENIKKQNLQRLNTEKEEKKNKKKETKSPAKEILKYFLLVTEDKEQKKIESNLYSSFNTWVEFKEETPATDFYQFFDEEASEEDSDETIASSPEEGIRDLSIKSVLNSDRNSSNSENNSEELLMDDKKEEIPIVARLDNYKTDLQTEANVITNSDVNNVETNTVCQGMSTMVLDVSQNSSSIQYSDLIFHEQTKETEIDERNQPLDCSAKIFETSNTLESNLQQTSFVTSEGSNLLNYPERPSNIVHSSNYLNSPTSAFDTPPTANIHNSPTNFSPYFRDNLTNYCDSSFGENPSVVDYTLPKVKTITENPPNTDNYSFQDSQFQENADALSVLASVCAAQKGNNSPSKIIKVKDYARWKPTTTSYPEIDPKALYQFSDNSDVMSSRVVNVYPEDAFDKVALQVEVISTSDGLTDNMNQSFRETPNVILNGETVILLQKSPNSNVYIINKAKENKNSDDEDDDEKLRNDSDIPQDTESQHKNLNIKTEVDDLVLKTEKKKNCRQNVKQEFTSCNGIPLIPHEHNSQLHPTTIPTYFSPNTEIRMPYHKHCNTLPINPSNAQNSLCTCLAPPYEVMTHCHSHDPSTFIENNSYFLPQQQTTVQEHERTKPNHSRLTNLYDDQQLYCKHEAKTKDEHKFKEIKYQREINNRLPLKKRLKPYDMSIKQERFATNPEIPSMITPPEIGATVELTTAKEDSPSPIENRHLFPSHHYHHHHHQGEKISDKDQRRLVNSQLSNVPLLAPPSHYHESRYQRPGDIKTSKGNSTLKRSAIPEELQHQQQQQQQSSTKKARRSTSRQTRSSQRKRPKVNYNYSGDELYPSCSKRKRKRTSR